MKAERRNSLFPRGAPIIDNGPGDLLAKNAGPSQRYSITSMLSSKRRDAVQAALEIGRISAMIKQPGGEGDQASTSLQKQAAGPSQKGSTNNLVDQAKLRPSRANGAGQEEEIDLQNLLSQIASGPAAGQRASRRRTSMLSLSSAIIKHSNELPAARESKIVEPSAPQQSSSAQLRHQGRMIGSRYSKSLMRPPDLLQMALLRNNSNQLNNQQDKAYEESSSTDSDQTESAKPYPEKYVKQSLCETKEERHPIYPRKSGILQKRRMPSQFLIEEVKQNAGPPGGNDIGRNTRRSSLLQSRAVDVAQKEEPKQGPVRRMSSRLQFLNPPEPKGQNRQQNESTSQGSTGFSAPATQMNKKGEKKATLCPHTNAKHYAKGMCNQCYHTYGRVQKAGKATECPHHDRPAYAKHMCRNCYINKSNKEKKRRNKAKQ